jgi:hypothetical protein
MDFTTQLSYTDGIPAKHTGAQVSAQQEAPYRLKTVIVALTFVSIGLLSLISSLLISKEYELVKALLRELATIAIIGATLHAIYELFQRQDFMQITNYKGQQVLDMLDAVRVELLDEIGTHGAEVLARIDLANQATQLGMTGVTPDARSYDFSAVLDAPRLTAVLNDGRTWVLNNAIRLQARFQDPSKSTVFILVHPDSPLIPILAAKQGINEEATRQKLGETLRLLSSFGAKETNLHVYGHRLFNPHSLFIIDGFAIVTPYFHSRMRRRGPAIRFDDTGHDSFYSELRRDIEALLVDSEELPLPESTTKTSNTKPMGA